MLLEVPDRVTPSGLAERLRTRPIDGVTDVLPAAGTVLLTLAARASAAKIADQVHAVVAELVDRGIETASTVEPLLIPVCYDGPDLTETADALGITETELIDRHTKHLWRCAFVGFAPGFGYLESPDADLTVPRRDRSRTSIPAGSVALAGGYSAVYPRKSPGGWRIIGRTEVTLWDLDRTEPALLRPGTRVRFVRVDANGSRR